MQAVVYRGLNDLRVETIPVPRIGASELLVRVAVCGVCPTDIKKIQHGTVPPPRIFGWESTISSIPPPVQRRPFASISMRCSPSRAAGMGARRW